MGASQSATNTKRNSDLYIRSVETGAYEPISYATLYRNYLAEEEMTPHHRKLYNEGNLMRAQLFKKNSQGQFVDADQVYYRYSGPIVDEAKKMMAEYWKTKIFQDLINELTELGKESMKVAEDILAQVCKQGYEMFDTVPKDQIAAIIARHSEISSSAQEKITELLYKSYLDVHKQIAGIRGDKSVVEPIMGGFYGKLASVKDGSGPEEQLALVKSSLLEKLSRDKEKLVGQLLAIFEHMPYKGLSEIKGTPQERLRKIGDFLRRPAQNAEAICANLVKAVNETFGVMVIDPHLPADICATQLGELLNSLSHGVSSDFFLIGIDINRDIMAIIKLVSVLELWRNALREKYAKQGSPLEAEELLVPLNAIIDEFKRYVTLIRASLNQHYQQTLPALLMDSGKQPPGTLRSRSLSDNITAIMRGIVTTASNALTVSAALEKIGMSVDEFRAFKDARAFYARFAELVTDEKLRTSENPDEYFTAAQIIFQGLGNANALANAIEDARKRVGVSGGEPGKQPEQLAIRTYDVRKKRMNLVTNTYGVIVQSGIRKIREAIDHFSGAIGTEIPLGNLLGNFIDFLRQLVDIKLEQPKIHLALLGYYRDAASKETRDRMIGTLKSIASYAEFVAKDAQYAKSKMYFTAISSAIEEFIAAIDQASDSVRTMVVGGEVEGAAGEDMPFATTIRELVVRDKLRLVDSVEKADYMTRVAQIKSNLARMVESFKSDTETYDARVLGPAVAARLDMIDKGYARVINTIKAGSKSADGTFDPDAAITPVGAKFDYISKLDFRTHGSENTRITGFFEQYYKALRGFWESAQAIELYLKYFTNALITNPGAISDIAMMIREVEVITEMYNEKAGDTIAQIFESNFPRNKDLASDLNPANGNIEAVGVRDGVSYFEWEGVGALPFTQVMAGKLNVMIDNARAGLEQYMALKNLVSFFVHFGSQIGGAEIRRIALRTPAEIYRGLVQFMAASSFAAGFIQKVNATDSAHLSYNVTEGTFTSRSFVPSAGATTAAGADAVANVPDAAGGNGAHNLFGCGYGSHASNSVFLRPYQQKITIVNAAAKPSIYDEATALDLSVENQAFSAIIKALGAKVLVLSGMYDLIDRPHEAHESRAAVRMILGAGTEDAPPKVDEAVTELYVRLPLLALYYKRTFSDNPQKVAQYVKDTARIVLLPDLSGSVFSEFISYIFRRFPHVDTQFFTDSEMRTLVTEINKIHEKLASKYTTDTCRSILQEFVQVMSKMIYIIGEEDLNSYNKQLRMDTGFRGQASRDEVTNIDILGEEGFEDEMIKRPMPSDIERMHMVVSPTTPDTRDFAVRAEHWDIVRKFRCMIDSELAKPSTASLRGSIVSTQVKLGQTADVSERFRLICGLVRGTGGITTIDNLRRMIFMEIMGTGLGMLSAIYSTVRQFQIAVAVSSPNIVADQLLGIKTSEGDTLAVIKALSSQIAQMLNLKDNADSMSMIDEALSITMGYDNVNNVRKVMTSSTRDITVSIQIANGGVNMGGIGVQATTTDKNIIRAHCLYYPAAMSVLLESIAALTSHTHEFVRVDISNGELLVDFGVLQNYVKKFISVLGSFVDKARPHIDPTIVERYTRKETPGSLYWLQEQFIEKLTEGRKADVAPEDGREYYTLAHITHAVKDAFKSLTAVIPKSTDVNVDPKMDFRVDYASAMARLIAHDMRAFAPGSLFRNANVLANPFDAVLIRGSAGEKTIDTRFLCSFAMTGENEVYGDINNSILFSFNKLLAMFLRQMYDTSTGKIFSGLINTFAQGAFNSAILTESNTFPDHLAHYYVNRKGSERVRAVGEPYAETHTQEEMQDELQKYLKFLDASLSSRHSDAFGYTKGGNIDPQAVWQIGDGSGQMHKFIAGLMLAWFSNTSDVLDEHGMLKGTDLYCDDQLGPDRLDLGNSLGFPIQDMMTAYSRLSIALKESNIDISEHIRSIIAEIGSVGDARAPQADWTSKKRRVASAMSYVGLEYFAGPMTEDSLNTFIEILARANMGDITEANLKNGGLGMIVAVGDRDDLVAEYNSQNVDPSAANYSELVSHALMATSTLSDRTMDTVFEKIRVMICGALYGDPPPQSTDKNILSELRDRPRADPAANRDLAQVWRNALQILSVFSDVIRGLRAHVWINGLEKSSIIPHPFEMDDVTVINNYWTNPHVSVQQIQRAFKAMPEILPGASINALLFLNNMRNGIYDDAICGDIAKKMEGSHNKSDWVRILAPGYAVKTPRSQVISRSHFLRAIMNSAFDTMPEDALLGTRTQKCLTTYVALMTDLYFPETRANAENFMISLIANRASKDVLDALKNTTPVLREFVTDNWSEGWKDINRAQMMFEDNWYENDIFPFVTPDVSQNFADFAVAIKNGSPLEGFFTNDRFLADPFIQELIKLAKKKMQSVPPVALQSSAIKHILRGGFLFDRTVPRAKELNDIRSQYVATRNPGRMVARYSATNGEYNVFHNELRVFAAKWITTEIDAFINVLFATLAETGTQEKLDNPSNNPWNAAKHIATIEKITNRFKALVTILPNNEEDGGRTSNGIVSYLRTINGKIQDLPTVKDPKGKMPNDACDILREIYELIDRLNRELRKGRGLINIGFHNISAKDLGIDNLQSNGYSDAWQTIHDLFIQLNMLADVFMVHENNARLNFGPIREYVDSLISHVVTNNTLREEIQKNDVIRNGIFDGFIPRADAYFTDSGPGLALQYVMRDTKTPGALNIANIIRQRSTIMIPTTSSTDLESNANRKRDFMQSLTMPLSTPGPELVKPATSRDNVKHIITLKEMRDAQISTEESIDQEGAVILYPGDDNQPEILWNKVKNYHATLHHVPADKIADYHNFISRASFENRVIPDGAHVLFASLGHILNNILTTTDERTQLRVHLLESAADIPSYLREKYRAQIPFFRAAFDSLAHKCEFYKRIMENMAGECFHTTTDDATINLSRNFASVGYNFGTASVSEKLIGVLKTVTTGASALVQDCSHSLTDIGDQPRYFETAMDSINAYRAQNNGDPIMPLSALLRITRSSQHPARSIEILEEQLQPKFGFGDPAFKYQYAIRGLYHRMDAKPRESTSDLQTLAALESMVNLFNKFSHGGIKIDAGLANDLAHDLTCGFDFLHDVHRVKRFISITDGGVFTNSVPSYTPPIFASIMCPNATTPDSMKNTAIRILRIAPPTTDAIHTVPPPFGLSARDISNVINIVENRNREDAITSVVSQTLGAADTRGDAIAANIVDMNIVPFDLHVLARQIPLHFIWNYAFTFDAIAASILFDKLHPSDVMAHYFEDCNDGKTSGPIQSARDAMFVMLTDPYRTFTRDEKNWVDRMLIGATGIPEFARPKFLSDQLAGKILLGHTLTLTHPEVGPPSRYTRAYMVEIGNGQDVFSIPEESSVYKAILTIYTNTLPTPNNQELRDAVLVLAQSRPACPEKITDDDYFTYVMYSVSLAGAASQGRDAAKNYVRQNPEVLRQLKQMKAKYGHRGTAAVIYASSKMSDNWTTIIEKWVPPPVTAIVNLYADVDINNRINYKTVFDGDVLANSSYPQEHSLVPIDDYGAQTTYSAAPAILLAREIHDMRMDTLLVRNLIHIGLVLAIVQMRLHGDTTYLTDHRVAASMSTLNPSIYKFFGNQTQADFNKRVSYEHATKKYI